MPSQDTTIPRLRAGARVARDHGFKGRPDSGLVLLLRPGQVLVLVDGAIDAREWWPVNTIDHVVKA